MWAGDAVYADVFAGLNWTAIGLHRKSDGGWTLTFPPPSIHIDATPEVIQGWYEKQLGVEDYQTFVEGWYGDGETNDGAKLTRPIIFGT